MGVEQLAIGPMLRRIDGGGNKPVHFAHRFGQHDHARGEAIGIGLDLLQRFTPQRDPVAFVARRPDDRGMLRAQVAPGLVEAIAFKAGWHVDIDIDNAVGRHVGRGLHRMILSLLWRGSCARRRARTLGVLDRVAVRPSSCAPDGRQAIVSPLSITMLVPVMWRPSSQAR